jgi:ABC-2 type transport system permease protein
MGLWRDTRAFVRRDALEAWRTQGFLATQLVLVATAAAGVILLGPHLDPNDPGFLNRPQAFLLTGVMVLDMIWGTTLAAPMRAHRDQAGGMFDACRVTGAPMWRLIVLPQVFPTLLATGRCVAYGLAGALFIRPPLHPERLLELSVVFLMAAATMGFVGVVLRSLVLTFGRRLPFGLLFGAVATVCSGLFFPVSALPSGAAAISKVLPTTYMVEGMRRCMVLGQGFGELSEVLLWLGGLLVLITASAVATVKATTYRLRRTDPTGND